MVLTLQREGRTIEGIEKTNILNALAVARLTEDARAKLGFDMPKDDLSAYTNAALRKARLSNASVRRYFSRGVFLSALVSMLGAGSIFALAKFCPASVLIGLKKDPKQDLLFWASKHSSRLSSAHEEIYGQVRLIAKSLGLQGIPTFEGFLGWSQFLVNIRGLEIPALDFPLLVIPSGNDQLVASDVSVAPSDQALDGLPPSPGVVSHSPAWVPPSLGVMSPSLAELPVLPVAVSTSAGHTLSPGAVFQPTASLPLSPVGLALAPGLVVLTPGAVPPTLPPGDLQSTPAVLAWPSVTPTRDTVSRVASPGPSQMPTLPTPERVSPALLANQAEPSVQAWSLSDIDEGLAGSRALMQILSYEEFQELACKTIYIFILTNLLDTTEEESE